MSGSDYSNPINHPGYWQLCDAHKHDHHRLYLWVVDRMVLCQFGNLYTGYVLRGFNLCRSGFH